jgi:hypothetical protein
MSTTGMIKKRTPHLPQAENSEPNNKLVMRVMFGCWCVVCLWGVVELVGSLRGRQRPMTATEVNLPRPQPLPEYSRVVVPDGSNYLNGSPPESGGPDSKRANEWPHGRKDIPVPVKTEMFSHQGAVQLVDETGHVKAEFVQGSNSGTGSADSRSGQLATVNTAGLASDQPKHTGEHQRISSDGYVAVRPPNDSDHFASRQVTHEEPSAK